MSSRHRRKSLNLFRPTLTPLSPIETKDSSSDEQLIGKKKKGRQSSILSTFSTPASPASPVEPLDAEHVDRSDSPKVRPRTLQKSNRSSVFGSIRSLKSLDDDEKLTRSQSKTSSQDEEEATTPSSFKNLFGDVVIYHGEVQSSGGMFRKRTQYLVLTESYLICFRSHLKATEMYPVIPAQSNRNHSSRQSVASFNSFQDTQLGVYNEIHSGIALDQIIAAYRLDDGRPYFSLEISYFDDHRTRGSSMHLQLNDPREADGWLDAIRQAAAKARSPEASPFKTNILEYVARVLEHDRDYDPQHFHLFKVVQRATNKAASRTSSEDLSKLASTFSYLAIGINKIHLVPLPKMATRSTTALNELEVPLSFGISTLTAISMQGGDDAFQLAFRIPLQKPYIVHLASSQATTIAMYIRQAAEYLRPQWLQQPFLINALNPLDENAFPPPDIEEDHACFDRTLVAYCAGYNVDTSMIRYSIDYACEDAPSFRLFSPASPHRQTYTALELLAVMRALRYNESFTTISFSGIVLDELQRSYDPFGIDFDAMSTRSGTPINITGHQNLNVLAQEVRALALKSKRLRRLDFSFSLTRIPSSVEGSRDPGCGLPEALSPLCKRSLTNVDWLVLNGIKLGESDLDYLVDAASERACHIRALEVSNCELSVHDVDVLLSTLAVQESTLEAIDISGVQGRMSPELFQQQVGYFGHIRKINLARVQRTAGSEPLIAPETLLAWRLEELILSQTPMNAQTVDSISAYLASSRSDTLKELQLDQCGLSGKDLSIFFQSMTRQGQGGRKMHVSASENRLRNGYSALFDAIGKNMTPTHLTMRMIEFEKERHFQDLIQALIKNRTLKVLDISKASLPYNASAETCEDLQKMFAENQVLEELDISGEHAHLDVTRFGIGLNLALTGLKANRALKVLTIEHQNLGLQGANTLAEVLEENETLLEVHCENNDINLQSYSVLVNAVQKNRTILYMPTLQRDREVCFDRIRREIESTSKRPDTPTSSNTALRRTFTAAKSLKGSRAPIPADQASKSQGTPSYTGQDIQAGLDALGEKWDAQTARLQRYLTRNYHLAHGQSYEEEEEEGSTRPSSPDRIMSLSNTESLTAILDNMKVDRTPRDEKAENDVGLGIDMLDEKVIEANSNPSLGFGVSGT